MKRLTMKQIADQLNISRTTVSLVLKGKGDQYRISKDTQQRIISYVEQAGYRPNYFASALNSRTSGIIGAVFPDLFESFMGSIVRGIETVLYEHDYSLMISTSRFSHQREQAIIKNILYRGADGLLLVPSMPYHHEAPYNSEYIESLVKQNVPMVLIDRKIKGVSVPCVVQKDYERSYGAVTSCIQNGAGRVCCVSFYLQATSIEERLKGYARAVRDHHLEPSYILLREQNPSSRDLQTKLSAQLRSKEPPDAFFVTTSGIADKLSWMLRSEGLTIPIARFGSTAPWTHQELMDIPQPHTEMGKKAAQLLIERIEGRSVEEITYC